MVILGIDPGSRKTGFGLIEKGCSKNRYIHSGCIKLNEKLSLAERLVILGESLDRVIQEYSPDCGVVEKIFLQKMLNQH